EFKARWREIPNVPLYPFGHGFGYTTFAYGVPQLRAAQLGWDDTLTITSSLTTTGDVAGEVVVQLYIHDRVASRV
ncbi:beta-glucosidase, partial [Stenotrophomonas maltophilia]